MDFKKQTLLSAKVDSQSFHGPNKVTCHPQTIQTARVPGADMLLNYVERARRVDVNIIDSKKFAQEHPFLHLIHSTSSLLSTSQIKSEIVRLLTEKRNLVLQLVELETRYDSLRSLLREDEGDDEANAFCQANYGVSDLQGAVGELALAHMDLALKPFAFPGLSGTEC